MVSAELVGESLETRLGHVFASRLVNPNSSFAIERMPLKNGKGEGLKGKERKKALQHNRVLDLSDFFRQLPPYMCYWVQYETGEGKQREASLFYAIPIGMDEFIQRHFGTPIGMGFPAHSNIQLEIIDAFLLFAQQINVKLGYEKLPRARHFAGQDINRYSLWREKAEWDTGGLWTNRVGELNAFLDRIAISPIDYTLFSYGYPFDGLAKTLKEGKIGLKTLVIREPLTLSNPFYKVPRILTPLHKKFKDYLERVNEARRSNTPFNS